MRPIPTRSRTRASPAARQRALYGDARFEPGNSVTFTRDKNYWGRDLPINRGLWNFDSIRYDYYRDGNTHFEAFKKGLYDVRAETDPGPLADAPIIFRRCATAAWSRRNSPTACPRAWRAWCSTRGGRCSPTCACAKRCCICSTSNGSTTTISSISTSAPPAISTAAICPRTACRPMRASANCSRRFRASCAPTSWKANGRRRRPTARAATAPACAAPSRCSRQAGYALKGTQLVHLASGRPFAFEILTTTRDQERLALAYARSLKRAGIDAQVRNVDPTQFEHRLLSFDFDMIAVSLGAVALARQRAAVLLGLGGGRRSKAAATTWASNRRRSTP